MKTKKKSTKLFISLITVFTLMSGHAVVHANSPYAEPWRDPTYVPEPIDWGRVYNVVKWGATCGYGVYEAYHGDYAALLGCLP